MARYVPPFNGHCVADARILQDEWNGLEWEDKMRRWHDMEQEYRADKLLEVLNDDAATMGGRCMRCNDKR